MASPFRNNKKERRRWRKAATKITSIAANVEEKHPDVAAGAIRCAEIYTKVAHSKRRRKTVK